MQHPHQHNDDESTLGSKSPGDGDDQSISNSSHALPRIFDAGLELESLCRAEMSGGTNSSIGFPPTCLPIVRLLAGNHCCVDCGDERSERLQFASIGYGTLLCHDCAHRHATTTGDESIIRHIKDEHWSLRSTLSILEGSNTQMIDYVKHKPHWRPPKGKSGETLSEGDLAFKQIYLSKAAGTYRTNIAKKVDDKFYSCITTMRKEDAAKEERLQTMNISPRDPFQKIFEQNNVSTGEIPGFFNNTSSKNNDAKTASRRGGGVAGGDAAAGSSSVNARVAGGRRGRNTSTPLMKHESPSMDLIKDRINSRRNMNSSLAMNQPMAVTEEDDAGDIEQAPLLPSPSTNMIANGYLPQSSRRRSSDHGLGMVGEVGDASIQNQYDDHASIGDGSHRKLSIQQKWSNHEHDDAQTMLSYPSRATNAPPLGMYQRFSSGGAGDGGQQRPMYRPPIS
mmetsp:Transcript_17858/g.38593  ORF Transcript_17858/g.38593 Transcript_17858/m.38593 type:complete len:451 (-) Transcript_17858:95-1447(-)|eukprot:CAMPEP_0172315160 /NCGR_PEP_ID=MMETSP1058-20130122/24271_1 /TAXON_ID=83371 /ORGANISM="Detonula confervacea, Strain CCMP 353" /LENGTH=450 /DNA_ID=CAMNT_0013029183 /DNA_START=47 /DNA_END=1399 /DNA_ORIENTATION=+